ncbi:MAG: threonine-phosphate decarboxylase CobD [Bacillota bacterium]
MQPANSGHGGNIARAALKYGLNEKEIIDFSASINPLGPAPGVYEAIKEELWRIRHYPDPDCGDLPEMLAGHLGVNKENVIIGNGGAELIYILPRVFNVKNALVVAPTFSEYAEAVEAAGGATRFLPFSESTERIIGNLQGVDVVFICNPNNPTGHVLPRSSIISVLEAAKENRTLVVVDEAFIDFVEDRREKSVMGEACINRDLVVLYSMTKFFGVPGLRLGAAVAVPDTIGKMKRVKDPWSVNSLARIAGEAALRDKKHMADTMKVVKEERDFLFDEISSISGVKPFASAANFLLVDISETGLKTGDLVDRMGRRGVLVRDCSNFKGLEMPCIRVAIRLRQENERLVEVLRQAIEML